MNNRHRVLPAAIAAVLGTGNAADAATIAVLNSVISYSSGGSSAANISSSTATWSYDSITQRLTQTSGLFNARFNIAPTTTLFRHSITGLVIGGGSAAAAASYRCAEGNFGSSVGANLCGNYNFGANFLHESTATWGPGTAFARTVGGDDVSVGPQQSISGYNGFTQINWVGTTLTLSNATATSGYTWILSAPVQSQGPPPTPAPGFTVSLNELGYASGISNLDILGTRYDVDFTCGAYNTPEFTCTLDPSHTLFMGNPAGATAAVEAINGALTQVAADGVFNGIAAREGDSYYSVPFSATEALHGCRYFYCTPDGNWWAYDVGSFSGAGPHRSLVAFTPSATAPIPAAAWLFGGALGALGWIRRRQAKA